MTCDHQKPSGISPIGCMEALNQSLIMVVKSPPRSSSTEALIGIQLIK
jgi:hypothetical protein